MATCPSCGLQHPGGTDACPTASEQDLAPGAGDEELEGGEVVGEYRLDKKLGEGGFGTVYRAVHTVIGKIAAVKVLHRTYSSNAQIVSRFIAEARAVNQIRHKNIIDIFAFGKVEDGRHFFVMELLEGQTLEELLHEKKRLSFEELMPILAPVARALDAAHAAGIAHRDLKPENVFLALDQDQHTLPKLLDFGIAKLLGESTAGHKTRTGAPIGTPQYMSPEQCRGAEVDERTDVYSFGVLLHRALTGELPFDAPGALTVMYKHTHEAPPRASEVFKDLPRAVDEPLLAMLAKDPTDRPAGVTAALDAVCRAAGKAGVSIPAAAPSSGARQSERERVRVRAISSGEQTSPVLAEAKTVEAEIVAPSRTLTGSESDVGSRTGIRKLYAPLVLGACAALALAALAAVMSLSPSASGPASPSTATAVAAPPPASEAAAAAAPAPSAEPRAEQPSEVEIRVTGAPPGTEVHLGDRKLGSADGPVHLPSGKSPVELTLVAPKLKPAKLVVTPVGPLSVPAPSMVALPQTGAPPAREPTQRKEYENPY